MMTFKEWLEAKLHFDPTIDAHVAANAQQELAPMRADQKIVNAFRILAQQRGIDDQVKTKYRELMDSHPHLMPQIQKIVAYVQANPNAMRQAQQAAYGDLNKIPTAQLA